MKAYIALLLNHYPYADVAPLISWRPCPVNQYRPELILKMMPKIPNLFLMLASSVDLRCITRDDAAKRYLRSSQASVAADVGITAIFPCLIIKLKGWQ